MNRSLLWTHFNHARTLGTLDAGRLNRGLGVAQQGAGNHIDRYGTTATGCSCPDHRYRGATCKGMIALTLRSSR